MLDRAISADLVISNEQFSKFESQVARPGQFMFRPYNSSNQEVTKDRRKTKKRAAKSIHFGVAEPPSQPVIQHYLAPEQKPASELESEPNCKGFNRKGKSAQVADELEAELSGRALPKRQKKDLTEARKKVEIRPSVKAQAQKKLVGELQWTRNLANVCIS